MTNPSNNTNNNSQNQKTSTTETVAADQKTPLTGPNSYAPKKDEASEAKKPAEAANKDSSDKAKSA